MPLPEYKPAKVDFDGTPWQDVVESCVEKECGRYATKLLRKASESTEAGAKSSEAVYALLGYIAQLWLVWDSGNAIFASAVGLVPADNSALAPLTPEHLTVLAEIAKDIKDADLRARVADILWIRIRKPEFALLAVDSYLESASRLEHPEHWPSSVERLRRAADIAAMLGRQSDSYKKAMAQVEDVLERHRGEDARYLSVQCMKILLQRRHGDAAKYSVLCQKIAERSGPGDVDRAVECWLLKSEWHKRAGEQDKSRAALVSAAETYVQRAELHIGGSAPSYTHAADYVKRAIGMLRKVQGTRPRREELHQLLLEYQRKSLAEYGSVSSREIDLTVDVERASSILEGKCFAEAIRTFALGIVALSTEAAVRRQTEDAQKDTLIFSFQSEYVDSEGRTAAKGGHRRDPSLDSAEAGLLDNMAFFLRQEHGLYGAIIEPVRQRLFREHNACLVDWLVIVGPSPFVPEGREGLWARALHAGFIGDFAAMIHLLVPQIEHALRVLLRLSGEPTSSLGGDGIQEELGIDKLLNHPKLLALLGPDYIMHLRCLLVQKAGANLRSRTAHGLLRDADVYTPEVVYLWWLALRLVVHPLVLAERRAKEDTAAGASA